MVWGSRSTGGSPDFLGGNNPPLKGTINGTRINPLRINTEASTVDPMILLRDREYTIAYLYVSNGERQNLKGLRHSADP